MRQEHWCNQVLEVDKAFGSHRKEVLMISKSKTGRLSVTSGSSLHHIVSCKV